MLLGYLGSPRGLRGQLWISNVAIDSLIVGEAYIARSEDGVQRQLTLMQKNCPKAGSCLLTFREIIDRNQAEAISGCQLLLNKGSLPPCDEDEYYHEDILGSDVLLVSGEQIGALEAIMSTSAHDIFVVRGSDEEEYLIPAIEEVVKHIDLQEKKIVINPMPGLLDINKPTRK